MHVEGLEIMSRTPALFRQSDIARALRAVEQCGLDMRVRLTPDGSIIIEKGETAEPTMTQPLEARREFRL